MISHIHYQVVYNSIFYRDIWTKKMAKATSVHEKVNHNDVWIGVGVAYDDLNYFVEHVHA